MQRSGQKPCAKMRAASAAVQVPMANESDEEPKILSSIACCDSVRKRMRKRVVSDDLDSSNDSDVIVPLAVGFLAGSTPLLAPLPSPVFDAL